MAHPRVPQHSKSLRPPPPLDHKTCLCTKFRVICTKAELGAKEVGEFSIMLYWKMGW